MDYFYSATVGGFVDPAINNPFPSDAVKITESKKEELLAGERAGKVISADKNGKPVLKDPPPLTEQQMRESEITQDKKYLAETDYIVTKISEAMALGQGTTPLLEQYATELEQRELARVRIRTNEDRTNV